jgi:DNA (cytosine-5)-methyltransferase 1
MELEKLTKVTLIQKCKELKINGYSSKNKKEIIELLVNSTKEIKKEIPEIKKEMPEIKEEIKKEMPEIKKEKYTYADLFCGIGGFHQVFKKFNNFECVFACDIDEKCRYIYEKNYHITPEKDIRKIDIEKIPSMDIICAGFPCQSFSNSGKKEGLNTPKGLLFENVLAIAKIKNPMFMFLENVKHIKKINNGKVFEHIISKIKETNYEVFVFELSPQQLGIPQHRERVIFVCIRKDIFDLKSISIQDFIVPNIPINIDKILENNKILLNSFHISQEMESILNIWNEMVKIFDVGECLSPVILCNEFYNQYTIEQFNNLPKWKQDYIQKNRPLYEKYKSQWDKWYEKNKVLLQKKEIYGKLEWQVGVKKPNDDIFNYFIQFRQSGIRIKKTDYFPTLVAIVQTPIYGKEKRYITPRECARLQSFPEDFIIHENDHIAYKQFGNSVNVDVIHYVVEYILKKYGIV